MSDDKPPPSPSAGNGGTPAGGATTPCATCTVTLSPKDVKLCGAGKTKDVTATGTPGGGSYSFKSSDSAVATVSGSGNKGNNKGGQARDSGDNSNLQCGRLHSLHRHGECQGLHLHSKERRWTLLRIRPEIGGESDRHKSQNQDAIWKSLL